MWGHTWTEASDMRNFNFGFSTYKSDILVHLSQWQYWWWFWFALVWTLYLFIILALINRRTFQFNPTLNTSIRGHGKWGDFLVALIPLSWCGNILVNSNFILRMIEWQNESSLFTIRVQGKQWYWVYKYDATAAQAILAAPKNIGHNNWFIRVGGESYCADTYYQALQLGAQLEFNQLYNKFLEDKALLKANLTKTHVFSEPVNTHNTTKTVTLNKSFVIPHLHITTHHPKYNLMHFWWHRFATQIANESPNDHQAGRFFDRAIKFSHIKKLKTYIQSMPLKRPYLQQYKTRYNAYDLNTVDKFFGLSTNSPRILSKFFSAYVKRYVDYDVLVHRLNVVKKTRRFTKIESNFSQLTFFLHTCYLRRKLTPYTHHYDFIALEDTQDFAANKIELSATRPLRFAKGILNQHALELINNAITSRTATSKTLLPYNLLFVPQYEGLRGDLAQKPDHGEVIWGFKQKKYKRIQKFKFTGATQYDPITLAPTTKTTTQFKAGLQSNVFDNVGRNIMTGDAMYEYQKAIKFNRHRSELVPVTLARRLLRTKRTLVLPAHTNLTVITNSYDVVHSWFIPGLGIKLDCVPGRSTHHTFYIDNVGFYYGQCAEICGRYHHHMPIRLCALPFEQFLVWWQKKGLKRMHRVTTIKNTATLNSNNIKFRYQW